MRNPQRTTAHETPLVATSDKKGQHSPSDDKPHWSGQDFTKSALDQLLEKDGERYRKMSKELAGILIRMKMPPSLIEDLVQEAWLRAAQHRDLFPAADAERLLRGFLRKIVRDKAVDLRRHLDSCAYQSFDGQELRLIDEAQAQRAELAEQHQLLEALLEDAGEDHEANKELVRAHFFQGVPVSELALRSGMSVDAVDCRIRRLVDKMREKGAKIFSAANPRLTLS